RTPSLNAMSVGIDVICAAAASPCWSSVSIFPKVMSACWSLADSKTGPNIRHGPHHAAHQSTRVIPSPVTVSSKLSSVSATVLISLLGCLVLAHGSPREYSENGHDGIPAATRPGGPPP